MGRQLPTEVDVIVLGAGAAGLMCACEAGKRDRGVLVLERARGAGGKILLSGGGKCNFSNRQCSAEHYISENTHFCKSALAQFGPSDFLALLEEYRIAYEERELGRLFCRRSARDVVAMLEQECHHRGVKFQFECQIKTIIKQERFRVHTNYADVTATSLVVATGGQSYPQAGATDLGYQLARQFHLALTECRPGLVPLLYNHADLKILAELTGNTIQAAISYQGKHFRENILFTHQGLSGPAILQVSSYWKKEDTIFIDWLPDVDVYQMLLGQKTNNGSQTIKSAIMPHLPQRMVKLWARRYFPDKPLAECTLEQLQSAAESINHWPFQPAATDDYQKAEVTVGGIRTDELSSKTLEARKVKGLYFIGELVDVTGQLGGYNLQWAWSSGYACGQVV
ncbi:MAG: NAD(P)/FAD-dependent oxidoreductase [Sedimentisphaerales bacterium]|nr:NAD(P)/FAD-dependent oxidoreductase [Sedimentisphaerales bacterium]